MTIRRKNIERLADQLGLVVNRGKVPDENGVPQRVWYATGRVGASGNAYAPHPGRHARTLQELADVLRDRLDNLTAANVGYRR